MVSIPESSALTLRLLGDVDDDDDATDDAVVGAWEVVSVKEVVPLLEMTAESKSQTTFFL